MTLKTRVAGFLTFAPGDDVQTYLWRWLAQSWRTTDGLFDPVSGHNHNGSGMNGPIISGGGGAGVPINWRGTWSTSTTYMQNDGVNYQGSSYVATASNIGTAPPAAPWQLVAQQGSTGPAGPPGSAGAPGPAGMTWRGPWQTAPTTYVAGDGVSYNGSSWIATAGNVASPPPGSSWDLLAPQGATGPAGAQGPPGASNAAYTGEWAWSTSTATAPNTGQIRANAATLGAVTALYLSGTTNGGVDASNFLRAVKNGDDIYVQQKTDSTVWGRWHTTGALIDHATWFEYPVSFTNGSGAPPNNNAPLDVSFLTAGATAAQWYTGTGAPASTLGKPGDMYLQSTGAVWQNQAVGGWTTTGISILGPQGTTGATGATGPAGPVGLVWRGTWASSNAYSQNDAVFYATNGSSYICTSAVSSGGAAPPSDSAHWALLAAGATGTWGSP